MCVQNPESMMLLMIVILLLRSLSLSVVVVDAPEFLLTSWCECGSVCVLCVHVDLQTGSVTSSVDFLSLSV